MVERAAMERSGGYVVAGEHARGFNRFGDLDLGVGEFISHDYSSR
jgi:hypothetical protein